MTSSSISLSKSSIDRGSGSGGVEGGAATAATVAPAAAPAIAAPATGAPLVSVDVGSTVEAISSRRDVAASSLVKVRCQLLDMNRREGVRHSSCAWTYWSYTS